MGAFSAGPGEFFYDITAGFNYDSNLNSNSLETGDSSLDGSVGLRYNIDRKYYTLRAGVGVTAGRYFDVSTNDYEDFDFSFDLSPTDLVGGKRITYDTNMGYKRDTTSDSQIGQRYTTDRYFANLTAAYQARKDLSLTLSPSWSLSSPDQAGLFESTRFGLRGGASYQVNKRMAYIANVGYGRIESDGNNAGGSNAHLYDASFGINRQWTPKLSGSISLGANLRQEDSQSSGSDISPSLSADLLWRVNDLQSARLTAGRSYSNTADDQSTDTFSVSGEYLQTITKRLRASVDAGFYATDFDSTVPRSDTSVLLGAGSTYELSKRMDLSGRLGFERQNSDLAFFTYDKLTASITVRYSY